jgi:hypothetical protein
MKSNKEIKQNTFAIRLVEWGQALLGGGLFTPGCAPISSASLKLFRIFKTNSSTSQRVLFVKVGSLSLIAIIAGLIIVHPENLVVFTQLCFMILLQMPLHELAHYLVAKRFFDANWGAEINCSKKTLTKLEIEFVNKYLAPRFGFNAFYGIESLKMVPAIFLQELNYTGAQFALILVAGPIVDFLLATVYITAGLALGPRTLLGFFSTQVMLNYGVAIFLTWAGAYVVRKLDLGKFRYSRVKRNACNRFLMGSWYLGEAVLDEQGQLITDNQPGQEQGLTRLQYLFAKLKEGTISQTEFDFLLEAIYAANPPLSKLVRIGTLLQLLNDSEPLTGSQLAGLTTAIGNVEKSLKVHGSVVKMNTPVYFGLKLAALGSRINPSTVEIQNILTRIRWILGASFKVPYFVAGGTLILSMEGSHIRPGGIAALQSSPEFGKLIRIRSLTRERQSFKGRKTIQVGIAKMRAPEGSDYSKELAHAAMLWDMIHDTA